ncbi:MAG: xanthan lyase [Prevotella sp.]|nr:xanthan lyase [Prevotella sp.]
MKRKLIWFLYLVALSVNSYAQVSDLRSTLERDIKTYFSTYTSKDITTAQHSSYFKELLIDENKQKITVIVDGSFAQQDFTDKLVSKIYKHITKILPKHIRKYDLSIKCNGMPIEYYVPGHTKKVNDGYALWGKIKYEGESWVTNISRPINFSHGLEGRHISVWASHGRYFNNNKNEWTWQRPALFGTTEDLYTQTIVVPYLIPMLEKAGAIVFTPRERDWQTMEYIVDPDGGLNTSTDNYREYSELSAWQTSSIPGFAAHNGNYLDNENPFQAGYFRQIKTTKKNSKAYVKWQPHFSKTDQYAVYVSYQTLPKSIDDAHYTVFHQGQATEFKVNQTMGGGTWVYLGTFTFDAGSSINNCVMLTNQSHKKGIVTADAVRFGGGMGNVERGGTLSNYPRALEGARYYAQWAGAPYSIYSGRQGTDDYADDINARSKMLNWLAGGSVYVPTTEGKGVPMELSLAVHSDAGYAKDGQGLIGSLTICTTDFNDGRLASGITRQSSKIFADMLLNGVTRDLSYKYKEWNRRYLWDKNYSETRLPEVPSAILETLSHQNFPDMILGQDPNFRFTLARSVYKTIARYVNDMHGNATIIAPLAPQNISVQLNGNKATISWNKQVDDLEPTAEPSYYILYTSIGGVGFDNGIKVKENSITIDLLPSMQYNFKVTAANRGGESFSSEIVSAFYSPMATKTVLVVNGFHRLSAPAIINNETQQGFDLDRDIGVSYGTTAGWNGRQINFDKSRMGIEGSSGLGYSGNELAGKFIAGNDFNYIMGHVSAITSTPQYNVASCSSTAIENGSVKLENYPIVDLILGLEKYTPDAVSYYKSFTPTMQRLLSSYIHNGGRIFASGAYIGSDMTSSEETEWLNKTLHVTYDKQIKTDSINGATGLGLNFDFYRNINSDHYAATHADILQPTDNAFCAMTYSNGTSAAVACDTERHKTFVMGFPFECINDQSMRNNIMQGILSFLLK